MSEKILDKIKKCLALASSANEHEAAAALRQAQKLMQAHGLTDQDVAAAQASICAWMRAFFSMAASACCTISAGAFLKRPLAPPARRK